MFNHGVISSWSIFGVIMRHKWADLIIEWAEGAEIESNCVVNPDDKGWLDCTVNPQWGNEGLKFRLKPKEPEWYENIPEHGVLCWVDDINETARNIIERITFVVNEHEFYRFRSRETIWKYATPLTNEEIEAFKR